MKKKLVTVMLTSAVAASLLVGCGKSDNSTTAAQDTAAGTEQVTEAKTTEAKGTEEKSTGAEDDAAKAKEVADLIDAIYVQERTNETDELCAKAKAAWDALTDAQKELVEGEEADPDYFGRDTGDASKDDPLNADNIGEKEILVVSFGTSFNDSRAQDIGGIEKAIAAANPDWSVRRAFTAQIIINLAKYEAKFESVRVAEPLLGEVGADATVINEDKKAVAEAAVAEAVKTSGFESLDKAAEDGTAFVFMGHGTAHVAKVSYSQMATQMQQLGYKNVFIGTVEGEPEDTACDKVIEAVKAAGYKKVILRPLMVVAGDHANNDMAGDDDDSWKSMFIASGAFDSVDTQIEGLGRIEAIEKLYVAHTAAAVESKGSEGSTGADASALKDGEYQAKFTTDSSMFKVNETYNDMGTLTVKDGKMTIHISLQSENIVNLFPGTKDEAEKDGAELLQPSKDSVTYADGTTETVNGFDVPVPYLDKEFDLALIGTKGKWYDHKVIVATPES